MAEPEAGEISEAWDNRHTEGVGQAKSDAVKLAVRLTYAITSQAIYGIDRVTGANHEGSWRAVLDYFQAVVELGPTVAPKRTINADAYAHFSEPVFVYSLKEGINDGLPPSP